MARNENPPFDRGSTFYNGGVIDPNNLGGVQHVGKDWLFEDIDIVNKVARSNKYVLCRVVRNISGVPLLPKRLVKFSLNTTPAGGTGARDPDVYGSEVDGYTTGDGVAPAQDRGYPVDEFLPAAGVPNNDLFYIVIEGPAKCKTPLNPFNNNINIGDKVVAASTAAATTGSTAGRVEAVSYINNTQPTATTQRQNVRQDVNFVGYAMSAATTGQTDTDILVDVGHW